MSTRLAEKEGTAPIPGTDGKNSSETLRRLADELQVKEKLTAYSQTLRATEDLPKHARLFLLELVPGSESSLRISGFAASQRALADRLYQKAEREKGGLPGAEIVLVSVESTESLRRAYPSYYLDTSRFLDELAEAIS